MIRLENVAKSYEDKEIIHNISLTIEEGEFLVLVGPSGCGKTTTLKMLNRLIPLTDGTIYYRDKRISDYDVHELRYNMGYVLQQIALFPHLTIEENIALVPELKKWKRQQIRERISELMALVGLNYEEYRKRYPHELSGGQQQRVGVIRALAANPDILLMDEPFSALDPLSRTKLQDELLHIQRTIQKTIVFVTHDMEEALKLADRICVMQDGHIVQLDTPQAIIARPANNFVKAFVNRTTLTVRDLLESVTTDMPFTLEVTNSLHQLLDALVAHEQIGITEQDKLIGKVTRSHAYKMLEQYAGGGVQ